MFTTIFKYELKHWFRQPALYVYAILFFSLAFVTMTGMASEASERFGGRFVNSPRYLFEMTRRFMVLVFLLIPAILGLSVYRDFSTRTHMLLYSFPFTKKDYIGAKFLSSFLVFSFILGMLGLGFWLGAHMPWVNPSLIQPTNVKAYAYLFGYLLLPDLFIIGTLVFGTVLLSRNIYSGFVIIFFFLLVPQLSGAIFRGFENQYWSALLDPFGVKAVRFYTDQWSIIEQNNQNLPLDGLVFYNRFLWVSISILIAVIIFRQFQFHQHSLQFNWWKQEEDTKPNFDLSSTSKIELPKINFSFNFLQDLKMLWKLSKADFSYVMRSRSFIAFTVGGMVFVLLAMSMVNPRYGTETLPMTWQMLELPSMFYAGVINAITFLYAGLLVHRSRMVRLDGILDASPIPNWVLVGSKFIALVKMQMILLGIVILGGVLSQTLKGFYDYEIDQYLVNLYGINLINYATWAMLALFIQNLLRNPYLGFFILLLAPVGFIGIAEFGPQYLGLDFLEQAQFRFNQAPVGVFGVQYSDMDGYGPLLAVYFVYKIYWALAGAILLIFTLLLWRRGFSESIKERILKVRKRFSRPVAIALSLFSITFISLGASLYYSNNIERLYITRQDKKEVLRTAERKYKAYKYYIQPKIQSIKIQMDLYPEKRQFKASGHYILVNNSQQAIDTLLINYIAGVNTKYTIHAPSSVCSKEKIADVGHFDILKLQRSLQPGDSLQLSFNVHNNPMTYFRANLFVKQNGTFIDDEVFPRLGNWLDYFSETHEKGKKGNRPHPSDSTALVHSFMAKDADRVDFEAIVSTTKTQRAIAPGYLKKQWEADGRQYFHYKMDRKIALSYLFMSGDYAYARDQWRGIPLEIYYHKSHDYNIDRMMEGLKAGLEYCHTNFSPYQFKQLRIIEFSQTGGASAHGFPNTIPAGEGSGFIADVDDSEHGGTDYPFGMAAHEAAHQWWGHQVIPADVLGAKMVVESLAEYVNVMVKKKEKGLDKMRHFLKNNLEMYLKMRSRADRTEAPLLLTYPDQNYIHYPKGAVVFYAMSDYIGEDRLNQAIRAFVEKVAFQEKEYTTSLELLDFIKKATPDSLQYLIKDQFETITFYDNAIEDWSCKPSENGNFKVELQFKVRKYRSGLLGEEQYSDNGLDSLSYKSTASEEVLYSLPLADYIDIGLFNAEGEALYLQKHKITTIQNKCSIIVEEPVSRVGIDPYFKLIDKRLDDNNSKSSGSNKEQ